MGQRDTDAAFDAYVRESFGWLCRTGFLLCGDWQRAEDAAQEALLRLHARWAKVEARDAYVRRSLVRILIDESRRPWRHEAPQGEIRDGDVVDPMSEVDDRDRVARALQSLTPRRRTCIVLRYYLDASVEDTALALGCSTGNVKRLTSDALAALRGALTPEEIWS